MVRARKEPGRPLVVGIAGVDTAGKTVFAGSLAQRLSSLGTPVQLIHVDDFHRPRAVRYQGADPSQSYYDLSFDLDLLVSKVLGPIAKRAPFKARLTLLDVDTDERSVVREYAVDEETIVLIEGVFLFRPELAPFVDFGVLLEVTESDVLKRAHARDVPRFGPAVVEKYENKYLPAQRRYAHAVKPRELADVVIDNSDVASPRIVKSPDQPRR